MIRDLNLTSAETWVDLEYRKVWCASCGRARVEKQSFCAAGVRITHRLARCIYDLCKTTSLADVARRLNLDPKTIAAVDHAMLTQEFGQTDCRDLRLLAIDEISVRKGQTYMTVVLDYLSGRVVWMGPGRSKETLDAFFACVPEWQKALIEAVAMDMWPPFIDRVRHHCPDAAIIFDHFHVVQGFGQVVDEVRRDEYHKATARDRKLIQGSRYLLLKNSNHLSETEAVRLRELLEANRTLNAVYLLRDQLRQLYRFAHFGHRQSAKRALDTWCRLAGEVGHPQVRRFIRRLRRHEWGILNYCDHPIGTSLLEGVNTKIRVMHRKAYGFPDPEYFILTVKQAFPGKQATDFTG
jgi:transposase